jgi:hypothetical protein
MNINTSSSSNQNSPRNNNDVSYSLTQDNIPFERREVRVGDKRGLILCIFCFAVITQILVIAS